MTSKVLASARYLKTHEWARRDGDEIVCGISDHAQNAMNDLVYVELPRVGQAVSAGDAVAVVESVKAASDVYAPLSGTVVAVNTALERAPDTINKDPYGAGWMFRLKPDDPSALDALMDAQTYAQLLREEEGREVEIID
ncbi:MAG: glycine cleavage system protein GcvH [Anaerolineae bacterium]|nr:glycine cleavage system protein GcvH [Thermoflexales bacterium]MDW8396894.1 glycine cleavage system protein GcvH [Anaerolineae bacterium]